MPALAQTAAAPASDTSQVVVTGSRIVRNGYQAPTPLTVVTAATIQQNVAGSNIASYLEELPAIANSATPQGNLNATQSGATRVNALNLRDLGETRTLVLVDGQRIVPSTLNGEPDLNTIPQQLVSRVDIVTGGASAVYGSDAVAGVVNIILDHKFTGVKLDVSGNVTSYGDNPGFQVQASAGTGFAGDRGHVILSVEDDYQAGVIHGDGGRKWDDVSKMLISNPAYAPGNGQPANLTETNVQLANQTGYGLVASGPLAGLAFGAGGNPYQFQFGALTTALPSTYMVGGTPNQPRPFLSSLENGERRFNVLTRAEFEVTPDITVFAQGSYATSYLWSNDTLSTLTGGNAPSISINNPYLPASVVTAMQAHNLTSLSIGTYNAELGPILANTFRQLNRITLGADGRYKLFGNDWTWNATYLYNNSIAKTEAPNDLNKPRYAEAVNAVRNPTTGAIECASTLAGSTDGCVPLNILGSGVADPAAVAYVTGTSWQNLTQSEQVFDANTQGTLFNNWAGPVSFSADFAHRTEQGTAVSNEFVPGSTTTTQWQFANLGLENGQYSVTEGAAETVFPLLNNFSFIRSWDLSAAARLTDYSTSGTVTTWKFGTTIQTSADLRLRATVSRDIRAPDINELYAVGGHTGSVLGFTDPVTGQNPNIQTISGGNPNLKPEQAMNEEMGFVYSPSFIPRLQFSVDYWAIYMTNVIASLSTQNIIDLCYFNGQDCSQIQRTPGTNALISVTTAALNEANSATRGVDFEASYNFPMSDIWAGLPGQMSLHGNATLGLEAWTNSGVGTVTENLGVIGQLPQWRAVATADYRVNDAWDVSLTARGFTGGVYASGAIQCTTTCPTNSTNHPTYSIDGAPGAAYLDGSLTYTFRKEGAQNWQAYVNVRNLLDSNPPTLANTNTYYTADTNTGLYDYLGRVYRVGLRLRF
ncbi:MAG TPA: TonB-dependent receptor [Caulobacteraceae bacterium]|nr:TonB-dependent receptor [Caulobacteraceae bacterium]